MRTHSSPRSIYSTVPVWTIFGGAKPNSVSKGFSRVRPDRKSIETAINMGVLVPFLINTLEVKHDTFIRSESDQDCVCMYVCV